MRPAHEPDIERPGGPAQRLQQTPLRRNGAGHAGMRVAIAQAQRRQIDGEDQRLDAGGLCARQHILHEAAILQHIELQPDRPLAGRGDLLDRAHGEGGENEGHALFRRRLRALNLAAPREHARHADGRDQHGELRRDAEPLRREIDIGDALHHALAQRHARKIGPIGGERALGPGAAVYIVEQKSRQLSPRGVSIVAGGRDDHRGPRRRMARIVSRASIRGSLFCALRSR